MVHSGKTKTMANKLHNLILSFASMKNVNIRHLKQGDDFSSLAEALKVSLLIEEGETPGAKAGFTKVDVKEPGLLGRTTQKSPPRQTSMYAIFNGLMW